MSENRYFRTSNFYLASYLFAEDHSLANIEKTNPKRAEFVFIDSPALRELVESFNYGKGCLIDVRKYNYATKALKQRLYDGF